jgi:hypothetical protein
MYARKLRGARRPVEISCVYDRSISPSTESVNLSIMRIVVSLRIMTATKRATRTLASSFTTARWGRVQDVKEFCLPTA